MQYACAERLSLAARRTHPLCGCVCVTQQRYNCDYVYDVDQTEQDIYQVITEFHRRLQPSPHASSCHSAHWCQH